jgi:hypothetical protein
MPASQACLMAPLRASGEEALMTIGRRHDMIDHMARDPNKRTGPKIDGRVYLSPIELTLPGRVCVPGSRVFLIRASSQQPETQMVIAAKGRKT